MKIPIKTKLPSVGWSAKKRPATEEDVARCWKSALDASSGKTYYYNKKSGEVSWTRPPAFDECNWKAVLDASSGKTYYYNRSSREVSWTRPPGMKSKESGSDEDGKFESTPLADLRFCSTPLADLRFCSDEDARKNDFADEARDDVGVGEQSGCCAILCSPLDNSVLDAVREQIKNDAHNETLKTMQAKYRSRIALLLGK